MPNTGSNGIEQMTPPASDRLNFQSTGGPEKTLFNLDDFRVLPLKGLQISVPSISIRRSEKAKTQLRPGDRDNAPGSAVEFWNPLGWFGLKPGALLPYVYFGMQDMKEPVQRVYIGWKAQVDWQQANFDPIPISNLRLGLSLRTDQATGTDPAALRTSLWRATPVETDFFNENRLSSQPQRTKRGTQVEEI